MTAHGSSFPVRKGYHDGHHLTFDGGSWHTLVGGQKEPPEMMWNSKYRYVVISSWDQWSGPEQAVWTFSTLERARSFVSRALELSTGFVYTVVEV